MRWRRLRIWIAMRSGPRSHLRHDQPLGLVTGGGGGGAGAGVGAEVCGGAVSAGFVAGGAVAGAAVIGGVVAAGAVCSDAVVAGVVVAGVVAGVESTGVAAVGVAAVGAASAGAAEAAAGVCLARAALEPPEPADPLERPVAAAVTLPGGTSGAAVVAGSIVGTVSIVVTVGSTMLSVAATTGGRCATAGRTASVGFGTSEAAIVGAGVVSYPATVVPGKAARPAVGGALDTGADAAVLPGVARLATAIALVNPITAVAASPVAATRPPVAERRRVLGRWPDPVLVATVWARRCCSAASRAVWS